MKGRNIFLFELKHCLSSKKFKIIILLYTVMAISPFLINSSFYYNHNITEIKSACDINIINGTKSGAIRMIILILLPLMSLLLYSDSFLIDYNSGMYKNIISRVSIKKYIFNKIMVVIVVTFFSFLYMFLLNEVLCILGFPIDGIMNNFGDPSFKKTYNSQFFLAIIKLNKPYLYDFIIILIYSSIATLHGLLCSSISLFFKHKRVIFMIGYFIAFQVIDILFQMLGIYKYHINYIINSNSGSFVTLMIWSFIIVSVSFILVKININSEEFSL